MPEPLFDRRQHAFWLRAFLAPGTWLAWFFYLFPKNGHALVVQREKPDAAGQMFYACCFWLVLGLTIASVIAS